MLEYFYEVRGCGDGFVDNLLNDLEEIMRTCNIIKQTTNWQAVLKLLLAMLAIFLKDARIK